LTKDLKSQTIQGLFWSGFERIGQQGIQFIVSIILARLLLPEQFGLIAMLTIFMAVAQSFIDSGFGSALIQKQDANHLDECSIFYFNILVSFLAAGVLFLAAPWIAAFYKIPLLVPLTRVLSLNLIINAFGIIQTTLLTKRVDFKTQMKVSVIASVLSGSIGVTMAYQGYGVWSLIAQSIGSNLFRTILLWFFLPWRPSWIFSLVSLRTMFAYGSKLLFSGWIGLLFNNVYLIIIGRFYTPTDLGFYTRANSIQKIPVMNISGSVGSVTFPVFSSVQRDRPRLKRGVRKALTAMATVNFPLMLGLTVVAQPAVHVLLTDKWLPCVPYLQLFCISGLLYPLHVINLNVLLAQGRSDLHFRLGILKTILLLISIAITYRWGILAMIYGQIVTSCLGYYINAYYTATLLKYPMIEQIRDIWLSLALSSIMGGGLYLLHYAGIANQTVLLLVQVISGVIIYVFLCRMFKLPIFNEVIEFVKPRLLSLRRT